MDTKALRQKILDLAIRGKLVPQNPDDEPARVLLERIRAEKMQMVKDGRLKAKDIKNDSVIYFKEDNLPYEQFPDGTEKCITDEIPFELPEGWEWARLGNIFSHNTGKALNIKNTDGIKMTYITTSNLYWNRFELDTLKEMYFSDAEIEKCTVHKGDLLVCEGGDIGRSAIWNYDEDIRIQNHIHKLRPFINLSVEFYYYIFLYYKLSDRISGKGIGIQGLSSNQLHNITVPVPPLSEQKRIAEKINELMGLVDVIEQNKTDLQTAVKLAKEKILDLAIRGQLVPQNPDDEPASVLLERIRAEKQQLIQQGKIKPDKKDTVTFTDDELPFELPDGWEIASFSHLNFYQSSSINPLSYPNEYFELFSVPNYELGIPEIVKGDEIGSTKQSVKDNDVLLCKINPRINRVWTVKHITDYNIIASSEWITFRNPMLFSDYICRYLSAPFFRELLLTNVSGVGGSLMRAQPDSVKKYPILLPPFNEQKRIADKINQLFSMLDSITEFLN